MDQVTAQRLLELDGESSLEEAEQAFESQFARLLSIRENLAPASTELHNLDARLGETLAAISFLRKPLTSVERAAAILTQQLPARTEPENETETDSGDVTEKRKWFDFQALSSLALVGHKRLVAAVGAGVSLLVVALLMSLLSGQSEVSSKPEPSMRAVATLESIVPSGREPVAVAPQHWDLPGSGIPAEQPPGAASGETGALQELAVVGARLSGPRQLRPQYAAEPGEAALREMIAVPGVQRKAALETLEPAATSAPAAVDAIDSQAEVQQVAFAAAPEPPVSGDPDPRVHELYEQGLKALAEFRLTTPEEGSALAFARSIEVIESGRSEAAALMAGIRDGYFELAQRALANDRSGRALMYVDKAVAMGLQEALAGEIYTAASRSEARRFKPGKAVVEVDDIAMLVLPRGMYTMGASADALTEFSRANAGFMSRIFGAGGAGDVSGEGTEVPPHEVYISADVAFSRSEITVGQFRRFVEKTGYLTDAERQGTSHVYHSDTTRKVAGRNWRHDYLGGAAAENLPVIHVSRRDAVAYAGWLSGRTGSRYRLPSESEFEYAARAGNSGLIPWEGKTPPSSAGNFRGVRDKPPKGWRPGAEADRVIAVRRFGDGAFGPAEVGTFEANVFGLESVLGNVSEWTADCYTANYSGKGDSQRAREEGDCEQGVVRGTDWASDARTLRVTYRTYRAADYSSNRIGFRVARDVVTDASALAMN